MTKRVSPKHWALMFVHNIEKEPEYSMGYTLYDSFAEAKKNAEAFPGQDSVLVFEMPEVPVAIMKSYTEWV